MKPGKTRREVLGAAVVAGAALGGEAEANAADATTPSAAGIPRRPLGRTGVQVSMLGLGGWHIGAVKDKAEAVRIMHAAIDEGVTFFDNSWDYHDGGSEEVMGQALAEPSRRDKVFLMTKTCERDHDGALKCLEDSLRRLKTDHVDLWQFHEINYDNDPDWLMEKGGLKAALEAKKAGKVRFIGFTGHKHPDIHLRALALPMKWDTAQMPINLLDVGYRSFQGKVVPVCRSKGVGVVGMKSLGGGAPKGTFFQKGLEGVTPEDCIRFSLSAPISTLVVGMLDLDTLKKNAALARAWKPLPQAERQRLVAAVKDVAGDGRLELFKSTTSFDGGHHRKQHGFG